MEPGVGQQGTNDAATDFIKHVFLIKQILGTVRTATLVQVKAVTNAGDVAPVGFVDVLPLVSMLDGAGNARQHTTIFHLPYFRLQGGANAVIIDPKVGDIGIAVIADRDISAVKNTKAPSNPGSYRRFALSDGLYIGGVLNAVPDQYVDFTADGITIADKNGNSAVMAPKGITLTDTVGNVIDMHAAAVDNSTGTVKVKPQGMTLTDVNKNVLDMSPTGTTFTDLFGNVLKTTSTGLTWTDVKGNVWASGAAGITLTTPLLACTGRVVSGFGGADQVELQTHKHVENTLPGSTNAPTAGT